MRRNALATLLLATALGGCSTGWFGGKEAPPLPGERLSVLALESELAADPRLADVPVELPPPVAVEAWSQAGGNPEHVVGHAALGGALRQAWSADIGDGAGSESRLLAQPVVVEGRVYALDSAGRLSARDAANGAELWRVAVVPREEDGEALGGGIAYANGRLYVTAGYAEVMAIDPANGGLIWTRKLPGPARAAPTAAGGRVFATTIDNQLTVVSAETGEVQWSHAGIVESAGLLGSASPAVRGNLVLVPYSSGELFALRLENGRPAWSETLAGRRRGGGLSQLVDIRGLPVIDNNLAFAISHGGTMAALDMRTGARAWDQDIGGIATPWVAGEFIYVLTNAGQVVALTRNSGRIRWTAQLERFTDPDDREGPIVWTGPVLAGGRLYVAGTDGSLVALDPATGRIDSTVDLGAGVTVPPVVAGGTLYILTDDATLIAFR